MLREFKLQLKTTEPGKLCLQQVPLNRFKLAGSKTKRNNRKIYRLSDYEPFVPNFLELAKCDYSRHKKL